MFEFHASVVVKKVAFGSIPAQRIITQLRTGYCYLNGYLHEKGLMASPLCTCGEPKSVKHFIKNVSSIRSKQGLSWTEIYFGHFVQAAPILFGHLEISWDIFSDTKFYHHKWKLLSALLIMYPGVVLLPIRMVSAV